MDKDIPLHRHRRFTLAISAAAARPANATARCGVAWLPSGPPPQTVVILRYMLASPGFKRAIRKVQPGDEKSMMGRYYPNRHYYKTAAAFERLGCHRH